MVESPAPIQNRWCDVQHIIYPAFQGYQTRFCSSCNSMKNICLDHIPELSWSNCCYMCIQQRQEDEEQGEEPEEEEEEHDGDEYGEEQPVQ
jgi:hypothetical protein